MHIYTHPEFIHHDVAEGHPERPDRLRHLLGHLDREGILDDCQLREPRDLSDAQILAAHTTGHLEFLRRSEPTDGIVPIDPDTWMGPRSLNAARLAASAVFSGVDDVLTGTEQRVFCAVRPPGHHAERNKAMGFCCISNAGVATNYLINRYKYKRIACVDFDVHWGNGNYDVMRDNKNSLYISTHQYPFYPGGGTEKDKGDFNNSLNIPLPAGTNSEQYFNAFDRVLERLVEYKPDFLLFSAGFDAHKDDPLAQFQLNSKDFYEITRRTLSATNKFTKGKVVSILEGGYDLNALAESANEHVNALIEFN